MTGRLDRSRRIWIPFFLTALFRAAGLGVAALALLPRFGVDGLPEDPLLLAALAAAAVSALAVRGAARRTWFAPDGTAMAACLLAPAAAMALAMQRTGLLESPFVLLLAALVVASALALAPLPNFLLLSGVALIQTFVVVGTAQGLLPAAGPETPVALLGIEVGLLGILGYVVNGLAWQLRAQQEELVAIGHRDRSTGALRDSSFRARLAGFLEQARGSGEGVALLLFDLPGGEAMLSEAAVVLHEGVRGTDLAGRVGDARLAAAVRLPAAAAGARLAARLASRLRALGIRDLRVGAAFLSADEVTPDGAGAALRLWMESERVLAAGRVSVG
jgi:GGDEF domain-containing protein